MPEAVVAWNDCSIRREGARKISDKKNWGPASKGVAARGFAVTDIDPAGGLAGLRVASFMRRGGEVHEYGLDSPAAGCSCGGATLIDWMIHRLREQAGSDDTPLEPVGDDLAAAGCPERALIGIGATRYTPFGESTYPVAGDESIVVVYDEQAPRPPACATRCGQARRTRLIVPRCWCSGWRSAASPDPEARRELRALGHGHLAAAGRDALGLEAAADHAPLAFVLPDVAHADGRDVRTRHVRRRIPVDDAVALGLRDEPRSAEAAVPGVHMGEIHLQAPGHALLVLLEEGLDRRPYVGPLGLRRGMGGLGRDRHRHDEGRRGGREGGGDGLARRDFRSLGGRSCQRATSPRHAATPGSARPPSRGGWRINRTPQRARLRGNHGASPLDEEDTPDGLPALPRDAAHDAARGDRDRLPPAAPGRVAGSRQARQEQRALGDLDVIGGALRARAGRRRPRRPW